MFLFITTFVFVWKFFPSWLNHTGVVTVLLLNEKLSWMCCYKSVRKKYSSFCLVSLSDVQISLWIDHKMQGQRFRYLYIWQYCKKSQLHHHTNFTLSCDSLMFFRIILFIIPSTYVWDDHFIYVNVLKMIKRLLESFANRIKKSFNFGLWSFSFPDDTWDILWKIYSVKSSC